MAQDVVERRTPGKGRRHHRDELADSLQLALGRLAPLAAAPGGHEVEEEAQRVDVALRRAVLSGPAELRGEEGRVAGKDLPQRLRVREEAAVHVLEDDAVPGRVDAEREGVDPAVEQVEAVQLPDDPAHLREELAHVPQRVLGEGDEVAEERGERRGLGDDVDVPLVEQDVQDRGDVRVPQDGNGGDPGGELRPAERDAGVAQRVDEDLAPPQRPQPLQYRAPPLLGGVLEVHRDIVLLGRLRRVFGGTGEHRRPLLRQLDGGRAEPSRLLTRPQGQSRRDAPVLGQRWHGLAGPRREPEARGP